MPAKSLNINDLHKLSKKRLPRPIYDYMAGGADDEVALGNNIAGFSRYQLVPQALRDVTRIDTTTRVLGCDIDLPFFISPIGQPRFFHPDSDLAGARAAAKFNTIFSLSSFSSNTLEEVAAVSTAPKMFQVYVLSDADLNRRILDRCKAANYNALCLTVDTVVGGNRERDLRNGLTIPPKLSLASIFEFARKPRWVYNYLRDNGRDLANLDDAPSSKDAADFVQYMSGLLERHLTWEYAEEMINYWGGPFAIKGVMSAQDALRAVEIGASAVIISNHGGRQLDSAPAPIEMVAEIREAVGDKLEIIVDGGIRRGSDIMKALALGADACSIGRPYVYGLGAGGQAGVERSLEILKSELIRDMTLAGCASVADITPELIRDRLTAA